MLGDAIGLRCANDVVDERETCARVYGPGLVEFGVRINHITVFIAFFVPADSPSSAIGACAIVNGERNSDISVPV